MRVLGLLLILAAEAAFISSANVAAALGQEAHTTRIETQPYYGAVVTIEHGVRVYRPVPPTEHMIIDPTGRERRIGNGGNGAPAEPASRPDFE